MKKTTIKQLKKELLELSQFRNGDEESNKSYQRIFDELNSLMGDDKFYEWIDSVSI